MQLEKYKLQAEKNEKMRVHELMMRERERKHELDVIRLKEEGRGSSKFEMHAVIKIIPSFQESEVVEFFLALEKIAKRLEWPPDKWTTLIQCKLIGKAQKEYIAMSEEVSKDYKEVKSLILKAYELVPEAYRLKFRELRKASQQTYVEFARKKVLALEEWLRSRDVSQFDSFKELMLLEEFKNCVPKEIKLHLEELEVSKLEDAVRKADEYALTHKVWYKPKGKYEGQEDKWKGNRSPGRGRSGSPKKGSPTRNTQSPPRLNSKTVQCFYCRKTGHVKKYCPSLWSKPVFLINLGYCRDSKTDGLCGYEGYIYEGIVGLSPENGRNVTLRCDTGATQSLICKRSVPKDFVNQEDEWVLLGGFPDTVTPCRLGDFWISSDLVEGHAKLAIVDRLPVPGIDVIVANDLEQSVKTSRSCVPIICRKPKREETVGVADGVVAAITRAGKRKQGKDDISDLGDLFSEERLKGKTVTHKKVQELKVCNGESLPWGVKSLIQEQKKDSTLGKIWEKVGEEEDCSKPYFRLRDDVLVRMSRNVWDKDEESNSDSDCSTGSILTENFRNGA